MSPKIPPRASSNTPSPFSNNLATTPSRERGSLDPEPPLSSASDRDNETLDADAVDPGSARRHWIAPVIKVAVSAGLLWVLLSRVELGRLWTSARSASPWWLLAALTLYALMACVSAWRWALLLRAQRVGVPVLVLLRSFLVACFFNNFLPSNIGGDVVRITDTAGAAGSKTLATTVILIDRGLGLLALVLIAALGATVSAGNAGGVAGPFRPSLLWLGFVVGLAITLQAVLRPSGFTWLFSPLRAIHREWVEARLHRITQALQRFRNDPVALAGGALGAVAVQLILVAFYLAIAYSIGVSISAWQLAVIVPVSFLVQMLPLSVNGLGVREATFVFYFARLGLPVESALLLSFLGAAVVMVFSVSGAVVYMSRR